MLTPRSSGRSKAPARTARSSTSLRSSSTPKPSTSFDGAPAVRQTLLPSLSPPPSSDNSLPAGELLGSAGDDGNVLLWVPSETQALRPFGDDGLDDKETWRVKHMCRSLGSEIYDMAWSPDGAFFITGSMDNVARIYNAQNGRLAPAAAYGSLLIQCRPDCAPDRGA